MNLLEVNTICGLCLRVDEKVKKLKSTHQKTFIESIIKLKKYKYVPTEDPYVCYICKVFVTKTYRFMQTIWKAQDIIYDMLQNTEMVTMPMLECIRQDKGLNPITLSSVVICDNELISGIHEESDLCAKTGFDDEKEGEGMQYHETEEIIYIDQNENLGNTTFTYSDDEQVEMQNPLDDTITISDTEETNTKMKQKLKAGKQNINNKQKNIITKQSKEASDVPIPKKRKVFKEGNTNIENKDPSPSINDIPIIKEKKTVNEQESNMNNIQKKNISKDPSMEESDVLKTKRKVHLQKKFGLKERSPSIESEDPSSSENESQKRKKKTVDDDYQPDSTSHSEDSDFDTYDDKGKRISRPRDFRVYPRQCDHCDYEVPRRVDHYHHYLIVHPNTVYPYLRERPYSCSICGKRLLKHQITNHELGHTNLNLKCSICPKVFPNKLKLYCHTQRCHPKKTFTCDYCSKILKTKSDMRRHIRTHTGSKPFKCHICGEGFAHSGNRLIHIRSKHQNLKYVPKKQSQKVHKNNKFEESSDEETIRRTSKKMKTKKLDKTKVPLKKKNKSMKQVSNPNRKTDHENVENAKQKHKGEKKTRTVDKHNGTEDNCDSGIKGNNAETESDEEMLIVLKKKKDGNSQ